MHPPAIIDDNVNIGRGTKTWHFSHILSNSKIDENCNIGQNVVIGPDVDIGKSCKIQNNVSFYKGITLEDGVFCGPSMVFTNKLHILFYKEFGKQKIDIVSFKNGEPSNFKESALIESVKL